MRELNFDWQAACRHISRNDPRLAAVIRRHKAPFAPRTMASPFLSLARAIVFQQLSGKAASTIHGRLLDLFPRRRMTPELLLKQRPEKLRAAGVSAGKQRALADLARRTRDGLVPGFAALRKLDDEAIIERLTQVHGIGRWTVEMLLIFDLGRPDVLPVHDLGVRKGLMIAHGMPEMPAPAALPALAEPWRPYRTVGSWFCWRACET